jgi:FkbM family methyltransferase
VIPGASTWLGRVLRLPLRLVPPLMPLRILTGPLAGRKWLSTAAPHGCWIGTYERELQQLLVRTLRPGQVMWDVGANVGFFTLLAATRVGRQGCVVAIEPLARNLELLRQHLELNRIANVTIVANAVADVAGTDRFGTGRSPSMGHLGALGGVEVSVTTVDELLTSGLPAPHVIKMDIEGAESRAIAGAARTLRQHRPLLVLSTHGWAQHEACARALQELGYSLTLRRDGSADGQYESIATPAQLE